jgi:uncharacterized protein YycO
MAKGCSDYFKRGRNDLSQMRIALYQGTSFISRAIRWQTRSIYSHAAFLLDDGSVIEAWQPVVRHVEPFPGAKWDLSALSRQHTPGTKVDILEFKQPLTEDENSALTCLAKYDIGTPYDYVGIERFVTRYGGGTDGHLFCSEQVFDRCAQIGRRLLERCDGWEVPPRDIARSPLLQISHSLITT